MLESPFEAAQKREPVRDENPFLAYDPNLCIRCQRCVGACNDAARNRWEPRNGVRTLIEAPFGADWRATDCESCGNCAQACPTERSPKRRATLPLVRDRARAHHVPHCGVGCQRLI